MKTAIEKGLHNNQSNNSVIPEPDEPIYGKFIFYKYMRLLADVMLNQRYVLNLEEYYYIIS